MNKQKTRIEVKQPPQKTTTGGNFKTPPFLFSRENYLILGAGLVLMAIGFLLMSGGQQRPDQWDPNVIYSFRRITLSTIVVLLGFCVVFYSIFRKPKVDQK